MGRGITKEMRKYILEREKYTCLYCKVKLTPPLTGYIKGERFDTKRRRIAYSIDENGIEVTFDMSEYSYSTIDHIIPISKGGSNKKENLVASCRECNISKNNQTVREWIAKKSPRSPNSDDFDIHNFVEFEFYKYLNQ